MVYTSLANLSSSEIQYRNISSLTPLSIYQIFRLEFSGYFSVSVNQMCDNLELILIVTSAMWTNKSTRKIIVFLDYIEDRLWNLSYFIELILVVIVSFFTYLRFQLERALGSAAAVYVGEVTCEAGP